MGLNMNVYRRLGYAGGTPEALYLAERLVAWHDAMVAHERRVGARCDDDCPHADAQMLWCEALETFGAGAHELRFLARRAGDAAARARPLERGA